MSQMQMTFRPFTAELLRQVTQVVAGNGVSHIKEVTLRHLG